jgi:hypothetical protein
VKRSTLILLTAIYLLSCVGIGLNRFYCCGKLASVTLTFAMPEAGKQTGKNDNCCKNEKQSFQIKDSHYHVVSSVLDHPGFALISVFNIVKVERVWLPIPTKIVYKANAPPGLLHAPIYTLNCTYRI